MIAAVKRWRYRRCVRRLGRMFGYPDDMSFEEIERQILQGLQALRKAALSMSCSAEQMRTALKRMETELRAPP